MRRLLMLLSLVTAAACQTTDLSPPADLIIHNAVIYTANDAQPRVEAVAVRGGRFVVVGTNAEALKRRGPSTRVIDAGGRAMLPGLQDAHDHFARIGGKSLDVTDAQLEAQILLGDAEARRLGVTMVHADASPREAAAYKRLIDQGKLKTRLYVMLAGSLATLEAEFGKGPIRDYRDRHLSVQAIQIVDGTAGEMYAKTLAAARAGFQTAIDAANDRAGRQVLDNFERVAAVAPGARDLRQRIEYAQVLNPADVSRAKALGVIVSMPPAQAAEDSNPMAGLSAAITGRAATPLSRDAALRAFTWNAAYAAHAEQDLGSIEPGKYADLVLIDRDVMTVEPSQITGTLVLMTVIGGEVVYAREKKQKEFMR